MGLAQLPAHLGEQGVLEGTGQVIHADLRRVDLPACGPTGHQGQAPLPGHGDHRHLHAHGIDGVHHVIEAPRQQLRRVIHGHEVIHHRHPAGRVVAGDALAHGLHLGLPQGGVGGVNLPVDIGLGHVVQVDQGQPAHAGTGQCLHRP